MKAKRKNDEWVIIEEDTDSVTIVPRRGRALLALVAVFVPILVMVSLLVPGSHTASGPTAAGVSPVIRETVLVPFDQFPLTYTKQNYSGEVTLKIYGSGQAGGKDYSDAFYLYKRADGTPVNPPHIQEFDLELDGQRAIETLGLVQNPPPYSPEHVYEVRYNVGSEPRPLAFRIADSVVDDNNGQFVIEILTGF
ncbi:MAG TPA: hypothetical protein VHO69_05880 [Phototrophicaceae bacterium]|nr:hypothetical protein [Phototrophicaceae bacterium]